MSIPSSPPALPDEVFNEPPSSPPLPPAVFPSRKRHAGWDQESSMSSDPIFSEDASEESETTGFKRKRYVRGPWYQHSNSPAMARVRADTHKDDSGVWMGSDSSTDSIGGSSRRMQSLSFNEYMHKHRPTPSKPKHSAQDRAAAIVFNCVDACKDSIDLSDMHLGRLDNETLRPLHQLIRLPVPINVDQKMTDDHFAPLTPQIKLFLSRNDLEQLPPELWNLGNLAVLSLRNNSLTHLSPSIGRLRNLHELNVAGNQLPYLPFELLDLVHNKLVQRSLSPNPFVRPLPRPPSTTLARVRVPSSARNCLAELNHLRSRYPRADCDEPSYEALLARLYKSRLLNALRNVRSNTTYIASSPTVFLEIDGSVVRSPYRSLALSSEPNYYVSFARPSPPSSVRSAAPSLFELSARACALSQYVGQLSSLLPDDASPPVTKAIAKVLESKEMGLQRCSVCSKQFLVPRARWVEYYYLEAGGDSHSSAELFQPFMRQACSWVCVDRLTAQREGYWEECEQGVMEFTQQAMAAGLFQTAA